MNTYASIQEIRRAVLEGRHRFSHHAMDELRADHLHVVDAESALLTGEIVRIQPDELDEPGPRYTIVGCAADLTVLMGVVCRFDPHNRLLIITCYEKKQ